jgi:hypothetical protein
MISAGFARNNLLTRTLTLKGNVMRKLIPVNFICLFLLLACQHQNPLAAKTKAQSADFLMNASANVEKRLHFEIKNDEHGYGYLECMEGKENSEIDCKALYLGMLAFAKEHHFPGFDSITLADLTDQKVIASLSDEYYEIMATTWPTYF